MYALAVAVPGKAVTGKGSSTSIFTDGESPTFRRATKKVTETCNRECIMRRIKHIEHLIPFLNIETSMCSPIKFHKINYSFL